MQVNEMKMEELKIELEKIKVLEEINDLDEE